MIKYGNDPRQKVNDIDQWFIDILGYDKKSYKRKNIYAGDAGRCPRLNVFHAFNNNVDFRFEAANVAYTSIGSAIEKMLLDAIERNDKLIASGYKLPQNELNVSGVIDGIIFDNNHMLSILEIKTCGQLPDEPIYSHLCQAQIYSAFTGINNTYLTYISRNVKNNYNDQLSIETFVVPTDKEALITVLYFAAQSFYSIRDKVVLPRSNFFRKTIECKNCDFIKFCWDNPNDNYTAISEDINSTDYVYYTESKELAEKIYNNRGNIFKQVIKDIMR